MGKLQNAGNICIKDIEVGTQNSGTCFGLLAFIQSLTDRETEKGERERERKRLTNIDCTWSNVVLQKI